MNHSCLPEPPLTIHPVCLAGSTISVITKKWIPERVYQSPILGFSSGVLFLVGMLSLFLSGAWLFLYIVQFTTDGVGNISCSASSLICNKYTLQNVTAFASWILKVVLLKTTFSLQLLCTIALQMARFLERSQLQEARSQLSWLCSRDPTHLNSEELAGGTLESLSVSRATRETILKTSLVYENQSHGFDLKI
jgi:cobalamin biosynthesis protein CobD/CbiB